MTTHTARHRKGGRDATSALRQVLKALRGLLQDVGAIAGILSALGYLPLSPTLPPASSSGPTVTVQVMRDSEGLEEFGGLARWRDVLLRFPGGRTERYRLVAVDGRLPSEFKRPLNDARTAYEWFELSTWDGDVAVYRWRDVEEH